MSFLPSPSCRLRHFLQCLALVSLLCHGAVPAAVATPVVAVSIKPLEHLVAALTDGVTTPQLVVRQGQDPHHISLRPSERRLLAGADLLLWVGPAMELPLAELVDQIDAAVITVQQLPEVRVLAAGADPDPHLWLDTANARLIAATVAQQLIRLDPANAGRYQYNLERLNQGLHELHAELQLQLAQAAAQPWAVYHHAFRYLEQEFGLRPALTLRESDNAEPGLRTVLAFRDALAAARLDCIVIEPGQHQTDLSAVLDDAALRTVEADVLGVDLAVTADSFVALISGVADAIRACAGERHE